MSDGLYLDEKEVTAKALKIVLTLEGVPMNQIEPLLKEARDIALASGVVEVGRKRFIALRRELDPGYF